MFDKKKYNAEYRIRKPEKIKAWNQSYRVKNRSKVNAQARARYQNRKQYHQRHYQLNKDKILKRTLSQKEEVKVYVQEYKKGKACIRCLESDVRCLDFHHRDPASKLFAISRAHKLGVTIKKLIVEIAKCELLCRNCHAKEHLSL